QTRLGNHRDGPGRQLAALSLLAQPPFPAPACRCGEWGPYGSPKRLDRTAPRNPGKYPARQGGDSTGNDRISAKRVEETCMQQQGVRKPTNTNSNPLLNRSGCSIMPSCPHALSPRL